MFTARLLLVLSTAPILISSIWAQAPVAGPNTNMVAGTGWPGGDPFLQRQNEPSIAVSSRNPLHLLAGANDYRTVDLAAITDNVIGDAWHGVFKSYNGGQTWRSTLLPGCQYTVPECLGAPALQAAGVQAGSDPTVRGGPAGTFYYSGLVFSRAVNGDSLVFLARYFDDNNLELVSGDPIRYLGTAVVEKGKTGQFLDKPWIAVDKPRGAATCAIPAGGSGPAQNIPQHNVYMAFSRFTGDDFRAKIYASRSTDCGATWSKPTKVSPGSAIAQGATVAVDPATGHVYVAWRRIQLDTAQPNSILIAKSTNFGQSFSQPVVVANITPFDQGSGGDRIRTASYPTVAIDGNLPTGRVYVAWTQMGVLPTGDARVVVAVSTTGGASFTAAVPADNAAPAYPGGGYALSGRGHQFMPALGFAAGKLALLYYALFEDHTLGKKVCATPDCISTAYQEQRVAIGNLPGGVPTVFTPGLHDSPAPPLLKRHLLDVRAGMADPGAAPVWSTTRVSQYAYGSPSTAVQSQKDIVQQEVSPPNLRLFVQGTTPFLGDYIDLGVPMFKPGVAAGSWEFNTAASPKPTFHGVWTDNRDVRPPADGNWTNYTPVFLANQSPVLTPNGACMVGQVGMRNQNIYSSRISTGLVVSAPGNHKQLSTALRRAFSVVVQNATDELKHFRLTIVNPVLPGGSASFSETLPIVSTLDMSLNPRSSGARTVFATSTSADERIIVNVDEITGVFPGTIVAGGLSAQTILNPDVSNPDVSNPDVSNGSIINYEIFVPDLSNPDVSNPDVSNPDVSNPDVSNPDVSNPDVSNPDVSNLGVPTTDVSNPDVSNPDVSNPNLTYSDMVAKTLTDGNWTIINKGNTTGTYKVKLLLNGGQAAAAGFETQLILHKTYTTPAPGKGVTCTLEQSTQHVLVANIPDPVFVDPLSPDVSNPDVSNTALNASEKNATITLAPGESGKITLRVNGATKTASENFILNNVQPAPISQASPATKIGQPPPPPTAVSSFPLVITTLALPGGVTSGMFYNQTLQRLGGTATFFWTISSGALPPGLGLNTGTGVISGFPNTAGSYSFTVRVCDNSLPCPGGPTVYPQEEDSQLLTIVVSGPLVITTASPFADAVVGTGYATPVLMTSGGVAPISWALVAGFLPPGLAFQVGPNFIMGTPTLAGVYNFTMQATDSSFPVQMAQKAFSLTVTAAPVAVATVAFFTQPTNTIVNAPTFVPAVQVIARDGIGAVVPGVSITMAIGTNPGGAILSGPIPQITDGLGIATFPALSLDKPGVGYTLRTHVTGNLLIAAASTTFTVSGWGPAPLAMFSARHSHTQTLLPSGEVLITGGFAGGPVEIPFVEVWNLPLGGASSVAGLAPMPMPAANHTATLLTNGNVLITGGTAGGVPSSTGLVFAPIIPGLYTIGMFSAPFPIGEARAGHTATLLPSGEVLLAGGLDAAAVTSTGRVVTAMVAFPPASVPPGNTMTVARMHHTATLLPNGKVLIAGGRPGAGCCLGPHASLELFDRATMLFTPLAAVMSTGRANHTATLLPNGKVLLAGGLSPAGAGIGSADLFDPTTNTITPVPAGLTARGDHEATLLADGQVLLAGGINGLGVETASAEIYNPVTNSTSAVLPMGTARSKFKSTLLAGGHVFVTGGNTAAGPTNLTELFVPPSPPFAANSFGATGALISAKAGHTATLLTMGPNAGRILVAGGGIVATDVQLYDPSSGTYLAAASAMVNPRSLHTATMLGNGKVLLAFGGAGVELYDQLTDSSALTSTGGGCVTAGPTKDVHTATLLPNGFVFLAGGRSTTLPNLPASTGTHLYDPVAGCLSSGPALPAPRFGHTATLLADGKVLIAGGYTGDGLSGYPLLTTAEIYDPFNNTISPTAGPMTASRANHTATPLQINGAKVLIMGGGDAIAGSVPGRDSAELFDPASNTFTAAGTIAPAPGRLFHAATRLFNGRVLITGGLTGVGVTGIDGYVIYNPVSNTFAIGPIASPPPGTVMSSTRWGHTQIMLPSGKVLITGGAPSFAAPALMSSDLFSPGP